MRCEGRAASDHGACRGWTRLQGAAPSMHPLEWAVARASRRAAMANVVAPLSQLWSRYSFQTPFGFSARFSAPSPLLYSIPPPFPLTRLAGRVYPPGRRLCTPRPPPRGAAAATQLARRVFSRDRDAPAVAAGRGGGGAGRRRVGPPAEWLTRAGAPPRGGWPGGRQLRLNLCVRCGSPTLMRPPVGRTVAGSDPPPLPPAYPPLGGGGAPASTASPVPCVAAPRRWTMRMRIVLYA